MASFDSGDISRNRVPGALGYLVFFLPLILCPGSKYGKFCANQGLWALIGQLALGLVFFVLDLVLGWIPLLGWVLGAVLWVARVALGLIALYYCYLAAFKGDPRALPVVGEIGLIK